MFVLKEGSVYKKLEEIELEKKSQAFDKVTEIRSEFNRLFVDLQINLQIDESLKVIEKRKSDQDIKEYQIISDFLVYPINSIWYLEGEEKKEIGVRICVIQRVKKREYIKQLFELSLESIKGSEWLNSKFLGKSFQIKQLVKNYHNYMKAFNLYAETILEKKEKIYYTSEMGWAEGDRRWHFAPVTRIDKTELIYDKGLESKLNIKFDYELTSEDAFNRTLNLLDVADKRVTIPLLSYTFLSVFTSLIQYNTPNLTKFIMCLSGNKAPIVRNELANLFCNFFDRKSKMSSINENYHSNLMTPEEELKTAANKIRDGIFIINTESNTKKISAARKLLLSQDLGNMILVLSEATIDQAFVLNINLDDITVNTDQMIISKKEPLVLSSCIGDLICHYRKDFSLAGSNAKKIRELFKKQYDLFQNYFEDDRNGYDINKAHYFSCLLIGFSYFLKYGNKIKSISDEQSRNLLEEAVRIFKEECIIQSSGENTSVKHKEIQVLFLENLLNLLQVKELPLTGDKNNHDVDNTGNLGWIEEENIIWVKNSIFKKIDDLLSAAGNKTNLTKRKSEIYKKLYDEKVILAPNDDEIVGVTVVKIEKSVNVASKPATVKVFRLDKLKAIELLKN